MKSPLRYPGGKSRAAKIIKLYFPTEIKEMCSPFFGGGSIELSCAAEGIRVHGYDIFDPLVCFWKYLLEDRKALHAEVKKLHPMSPKQFIEYQAKNPVMPDSIQRAAMFYALNRGSFSGSTLSGGRSPDHPRFNDSNMETLLAADLPTLSVNKLDCLEALDRHPNIFVYLDPPYLLEQQQQNKLYGVNGSTHSGFDHKALFDKLKNRSNWIMSYNNSPEIMEIYKDFEILEPQWSYGMSKNKSANEALIFSKDIDSAAMKLANENIAKLNKEAESKRKKEETTKRKKDKIIADAAVKVQPLSDVFTEFYTK
jgi:DNA adenine methylase